MVRGRRVRAVVACPRTDDCCSPHAKRRGQKIINRSVLAPSKTNTIEAFFHDLDVAPKPLDLPFGPLTKQPQPTTDEILLTYMAKDEVDGDCDVAKTPHRIELRPDEVKDEVKAAAKCTKAKRRLIESSKGNNNHKLTEYFPVRRSERKTKKTVMAEKQRTLEQILRSGKEEGLEVKVFADKGRGVVSSRPFSKGDFVVEYSGDLIDLNEARNREIKYAQDMNTGCYMYYFKHNDQQYCVDATAETGRLGRLVNHSRNGNLITRTVSVDNRPRLVLIAKDDIKEGDELTYDYGDRSKEALKYHPWLAY